MEHLQIKVLLFLSLPFLLSFLPWMFVPTVAEETPATGWSNSLQQRREQGRIRSELRPSVRGRALEAPRVYLRAVYRNGSRQRCISLELGSFFEQILQRSGHRATTTINSRIALLAELFAGPFKNLRDLRSDRIQDDLEK